MIIASFFMGDIVFDTTTVLTLLLIIARVVIIVLAIMVLIMLFKVLIKVNKLKLLNSKGNSENDKIL